MKRFATSAPAAGGPQRGLSLVELMVSLAIGVFLIGGSLSVYIKGRESYTLNETLARMQENASFAFKQLEPDIQLAGFWGTHGKTNEIAGRAQINPIPVAVGNECDPNWSIRVREYLVGSNNDRPAWNCFSDAEYQPDTDVLTIRRTSSSPVATAALEAGRLYIRSSTLPRSQFFIGTGEPGGFTDEAQNFPMIAHAYYVRPYSIGDAADPIPSLRRLDLALVGGALTIRDLEIVQGVEDMQLQFGIDTNGTNAVDAYVNPDSVLLGGANVLSVRIWLLLRSESRELGYVDDISYTLGDVIRPATNDNFRRMLVTRTILLRNRT